jgi:hypothetical protein
MYAQPSGYYPSADFCAFLGRGNATMTHSKGTAEDPLAAGTRAARELQEALRATGFVFPSLAGDYPVAGQGHVRLGGISAGEALRFAAWVREQTAVS